MTGRERIRRAIRFLGPDKVPQSFRDIFPLLHVPPSTWQPPEGYFPYVHPLAIRAGLWKSKRKLPKGWLKGKNIAMDEWGTIWRTTPLSSLGEVVKGPLEDGWEKLDDLKIPDMSDPARYRAFTRMSKILGGSRYRLAGDTNSIWERLRFLRGFENAVTDLIEYPDEVERLLKIVTDATLVMIGMYRRAGAHGFMLVDDWGTQETSIISPAHFRRFFQPCYKRIADLCHDYGMDVGIHSCGNIRPLVQPLIDSGMDFLELDSPSMCGVDWLAENGAGKVALFLSPDIQTVYPLGTDEELEEYIRDLVWKCGDHNGGLVAFPYSEPWVIGVNAKRARLQAKLFDKYGKYPIRRL